MGKLSAFFEKAKKSSTKVQSIPQVADTEKKTKTSALLEQEVLESTAQEAEDSGEWSIEVSDELPQQTSNLKVDVVDASSLLRKEAKVVEWKSNKVAAAEEQEEEKKAPPPVESNVFKPMSVLTGGKKTFNTSTKADPGLQESMSKQYMQPTNRNAALKKKKATVDVGEVVEVTTENRSKPEVIEKTPLEKKNWQQFDIHKYVDLNNLNIQRIEADDEEIRRKYEARKKLSTEASFKQYAMQV